MKSVLLYIADDAGLEARLQAALDLTRSLGGHLHCLHANPYNAQLAVAGVTGISVMADIREMSRELSSELRDKIEKRLADEDVSWDYREENTEPSRGLSKNSALVDLIVLSSAGGQKDAAMPLGILGDVLFNATAPIVVQPDDVKKFDACGPALVAWNGSFESGNALRAAVPLLKMASDVHILTVEEDKDHDLPQLAASEYLAYHGIKSEIHSPPPGKVRVDQALLSEARNVHAEYLVMGAYGHSRAREFLFGGVTRNLFKDSPIPLVVSH
ncbi:universal stress protein [Parasphingorhabdus flavimaris]|jgi:nucleotide-binding universal stress UspA family protein|uniref:Universal stress protein n=1 Tax=Parasphingorhabdus flavimaris TaxID=266812 RepID=A0ABX2MZP2_9SPHN|nr:universal stress protein [Parasphingorhabdus flavimaris]NVD26899.1 universal stress protein [Parasphingorhabdus flavimaris]